MLWQGEVGFEVIVVDHASTDPGATAVLGITAPQAARALAALVHPGPGRSLQFRPQVGPEPNDPWADEARVWLAGLQG